MEQPSKKVTNNLRSIWHGLIGLTDKLTEQMEIMVYSSLVKSVIEYGLELYIDANDTHIDKLEKYIEEKAKNLAKKKQRVTINN